MIIKTRIKDSDGNTVAYDVMSGTEVVRLYKEVVIGLFSQITNASLMPNGEFIANDDCYIDTIVDNDEARKSNRNKFEKSMDYYGKKFINICKRIRRYASEGRLKLDDSAYKVSKMSATYLFNLMDACGIDYKDFITGYLSVIQPYELRKIKSRGVKGHTWASDVGYGIELIIEIDNTNKNKPMTVYFHTNRVKKSYNLSKKKCAVIVDDWIVSQSEGYKIRYTVQRGFMRYSKMSSKTKHLSNDIALVDYKDIVNTFDDALSELTSNLLTNYMSYDKTDALELNAERVDDMYFMLMGLSTANNFYSLIDLYSQFTDSKSRIILADMALNIIIDTPVDRRVGIKNTINKRFTGEYNNMLLEVIRNM